MLKIILMQTILLLKFFKSTLRSVILSILLLSALNTFAQINLSNGLIAYYPFSGNALDSSGYGNNPSFNNASLTIDRFGNKNNAYSFNGNSSYIQIPHKTIIDSLNSVSLSFWVKVNAFNTDLCSGNYLFSRGGTLPYTTNYNVAFGNTPYGNVSNINFCNTSIDTAHESFYGLGTSDLTSIHTGSWYHVVFTNNGSVTIMYLNGNIVSAQTGSVLFNATDIYLGRAFPQGSNNNPFWFNGVLDDIRFYNRAITNNEVSALFNAPNPTPPNNCAISGNSQLVIKVDTANRQGYVVDNLTNLNPYLIDTALGSLRLFTWTNNGAYYNFRSLIQYQLTKIPITAKINSAKLYLYAKNQGTTEGRPGFPTFGTNNAVLLQKFMAPWKANTTSWYSQPTVDIISQKTLQQSTNTNQDYIVDMTDFVQTWVNKPDSNFGFVLRMQTENNPYNSMIFESGNASDPTRNMRLEICYADSTPPIPVNNCTNSDSQLVIKVNKANTNGYTIDNLTNLNPYLIDTVLGSVRLFAWTNNGAYYNYRSLMHYQLTSIPTNATVNSAKLYLYAKNQGTTEGRPGSPTFGTNNAVLLQKFIAPWQASSTSWYSQPPVDIATQKILPQSNNTNEDYVVDITDFAKTWVNKPDSNFGFVMRMQTESNPYNSMIFESGDATDNSRNLRLEICYSIPIPMPVSLTSFTATAITHPFTKIDFSTNDETNLTAIIIEKSFDGIHFIEAKTITTRGSEVSNQYSFIDKTDGSAVCVYYRLKMLSKEGSYKYSGVVNVNFLTTNELMTVEIFPNPIRNEALNLNVYLLKDDAIDVCVFDVNGRLVSAVSLKGSKGFNSVKVPTFTDKKAGIYSVRITSSNNIVTKKVVKLL